MKRVGISQIELMSVSGVDYREPQCYSSAIDQQLTNVAPVQPPAPVMQPPAPPQQQLAPMSDLVLRGLQSPLAGLAKLFGNYNLFG